MAVGMSGGGWWRWVWVAAAGWVLLFGRRDIDRERERDEIKVIWFMGPFGLSLLLLKTENTVVK